jgi:hypothetical protein
LPAAFATTGLTTVDLVAAAFLDPCSARAIICVVSAPASLTAGALGVDLPAPLVAVGAVFVAFVALAWVTEAAASAEAATFGTAAVFAVVGSLEAVGALAAEAALASLGEDA